MPGPQSRAASGRHGLVQKAQKARRRRYFGEFSGWAAGMWKFAKWRGVGGRGPP